MIDISGKIINNTYIIKSLIFETDFIQRWEVKAIFSPNSFFFDLVKDKKDSMRIYKNKDSLSEILAMLQGIRNAYLLKTIEFGLYEDRFFSVQQKITGISLSEIETANFNFQENTVIKMMDKLGLCLLSFEWRGLTHNLLSEYSIWIPSNIDNIGILYFNDTFLSYQLIYSKFPVDGFFKSTPSCYCSNFYREEKYHSGSSNDLFAFGSIFYKLITGRDPFAAATVIELSEQQNKSDIDLDLIKNVKIRDFISRFFELPRQFKSIEEMYDNFEKTFLNELSGKVLKRNRENSPNQDSIDVYNDYTDDSIKNNEGLEVVQEVEDLLDDVIIETNRTFKSKSLKKAVSSVVKTVFGFFKRFRKAIVSQKNQDHSQENTDAQESRGEYNMNGELPSGDLKHSRTNPDPERLRKLFTELTSHFSDSGKKKKNKDLDREKYNNKSRQIQNHRAIASSPVKIDKVRKIPESLSDGKITESIGYEAAENQNRDNPLLTYLLRESNYVSKEYRDIDKTSETSGSEGVQSHSPGKIIENSLSVNAETGKKEIIHSSLSETEEENDRTESHFNNDLVKKTVEESAVRKQKGLLSIIRILFKKFLKLFK